MPDAAETIAAAVAAAGFATWNLDLIFGAATESDADWAATLEHVLALDHPPPHLSAYGAHRRARHAARRRPGAPSRRRRRRPGATSAPTRVLTAAGYRWEEISNWARPGHECRHNHLYWEQGDYVGIGSAAHSHRAGTRWWNVRTPERYIAAVEAGRSPEAGREELTAGAARVRGALARRCAPRAACPGTASSAPRSSTAWSSDVDGRAVLTVRGRLLANEVSARIRSGILHR